MGFNIQNQNAQIINNVEGNQRVEGGQHAVQVTLDDARAAAEDLARLFAAGGAPGAGAEQSTAYGREIRSELAKPEPDRHVVADLLGRLTSLLTSAGSLVAAGSPLLGPLHALASWLGALGAPVLAMLPL